KIAVWIRWTCGKRGRLWVAHTRTALSGSQHQPLGAVPPFASLRLCRRSLTSACPMPAYASPCHSRYRPNGTGAATLWRPCTPARAAGLTDHVGTLGGGLLFRVPPWPQPAGV